MSLSNVADKCRVIIDTSVERSMNVYFLQQIVTFVELSDMLWDLIPDDNSFLRNVIIIFKRR